MPDEKTLEQLLATARAEMREAYLLHVEDLARDIKQAIQDGEVDDLYTYVHETCDWDPWVIYRNRAQAVVLSSNNDDAYVANFGTDGLVDDGSISWSRLAYSALLADIFEELGRLGVDANGADKAEMLGESEEDAL